MDYVPHSKKETNEMLATLGIRSLDDLFAAIPAGLVYDDDAACKLFGPCTLPLEGMEEHPLWNHVKGLAASNRVYRAIFAGAGCYHHYIPAVVDTVCQRNEFWTSYTPYQAEFSQGYLQAIFEYQSMICRLTGMDYSNASLHDGATATADAMVMALAQNRKRGRILVLGNVNPWYVDVVRTTLGPRNITIQEVPLGALETSLSKDVAAVIFQNPDFLGNINDVHSIAEIIHNFDKDIIVIELITEAISFGLLKPPGSMGVDIVVGDGQSFGIPMNFGGPGLGFMAVSDRKLLHRMPGRIVGIARELQGNGLGFTLTLQAREQHIRRERALSNICSNEALNMLRAAVFMAAVGSTGLDQLAKINACKASYLKKKITRTGAYKCENSGPIFNEFTIRVPDKNLIEKIASSCEERGILGPIPLKLARPGWNDLLLFCVTEMASREVLDEMATLMEEVLVE